MSDVQEPLENPAPETGTRRRLVRGALFIAAPLAALAAVVYVTRRDAGVAEAGDSAHAHEAMQAPASREGKPVMLSAADARRIGVTYAAATAGPLGRDVRTVGQVTFDERRMRTIAPKVDGWVEQLHVSATGQPVRVGEPLLTIYSPMLVAAQEELLLAKRLARDVSSGTPDARRGADDLLAAARRRLAYWDVPEGEIARVEESGEVRRTVTLRATAGGVVVEKNVSAGQRVMAGDALYRVADLSRVWVEGEVYEQDLAAAREGLPVRAQLEAFPGEEWTGRIAYVYPTLDAETRTARLRVELANPGLRLKPGMYATLRFTGAGRASVLSVPRAAVLSTGERNLVFLKRPDGMLEPRLVAVGAASDERIEIVRGLAPGDSVVASATFLVDAESNLGTLMGGMGNMPGMDMTAPTEVPGMREGGRAKGDERVRDAGAPRGSSSPVPRPPSP